ncbi:MAG TPA: TonB-dependent receptor plug domain-containing protein, partial [Phnomibacter sp.]|nr:TonB-dependent receptor plug domain-containing protein [Phnomibacter sp.]
MKKMWSLLTGALLLSLLSIAQTSAITGKVTDARNGNPIEGASILLKGQRTGASTRADGSFSINAPQGAVLIVSSVGYRTQEVTASNGVANVSLEPISENLTDVVVVGYGTQKRATLSGSQVQLKNADLTRRQVSSTSQVLQGLAPGVTVQQQSGRPGADGASVRIRGESSILGNSNPLVVIDGLQMPNTTGLDALNQIDPNAIESITVLKDAASTAIYGNRGAAGVILVKTKRATKEGLKLSYNSFISKQDFTSIPARVSAVDHMELSNLAERNRTGNPAATVFPQSLIDKYKNNPADNFEIIDTDWLNEVLTNSGTMQNHNVQLVAAGEKFNVFSSFTFFDQQGLIQNNSFRRYDLRVNPEYKVSKYLTLTGNLAYTSSTT